MNIKDRTVSRECEDYPNSLCCGDYYILNFVDRLSLNVWAELSKAQSTLQQEPEDDIIDVNDRETSRGSRST